MHIQPITSKAPTVPLAELTLAQPKEAILYYQTQLTWLREEAAFHHERRKRLKLHIETHAAIIREHDDVPAQELDDRQLEAVERAKAEIANLERKSRDSVELLGICHQQILQMQRSMDLAMVERRLKVQDAEIAQQIEAGRLKATGITTNAAFDAEFVRLARETLPLETFQNISERAKSGRKAKKLASMPGAVQPPASRVASVDDALAAWSSLTATEDA